MAHSQQQLHTQCKTSIKKIQEQLQCEIKKNKNLLQTNFTLMEENQLYVNAFDQLRQSAIAYQSADYASNTNTQQVDQLQDINQLVAFVISKLSSSHHNSNQISHNTSQPEKQLEQSSKWKQLYIKSTQQCYKLSQYNNEFYQKITQLQKKYQEDCFIEGKNMMERYLDIFRRAHSVDCIGLMGKTQKNIGTKKDDILSREKEQRDSCKSRSKQNNRSDSNSQQKKHKPYSKKHLPLQTQLTITKKTVNQIPEITSLSPQQMKSIKQQIVQHLKQYPLQDFIHNYLMKYLDKIIDYLQTMKIQISQLREAIQDRQILLRVYRQKQRQALFAYPV